MRVNQMGMLHLEKKDLNNVIMQSKMPEEEQLKKYFEHRLLQSYERIIWTDIKTNDYYTYFDFQEDFYRQPRLGVHNERVAYMKYYFVHKDDKERYEADISLKNLKEILDSDEQEIIRYFRLLSPNNEYRWKCYRISYLDEELTTILVSIQDIHDIRLEEQKHEDVVRTLMADALKAEKKSGELRQRFYEAVIKEIRSLIFNIGENSTISAGEEENQSLLKSKLDMIHRVSSRFSETIENILRMNQLESGMIHSERVEENLHVLMKNICEDQRRKAAKQKVQILETIDLSAECYRRADIVCIRYILENILENAVKLSKAGSVVHVTIKEKPVKDKELLLCMVVENAGEGIGLSLVLCKRMAELLGGSVKVTQEKSGRNYFSVQLPIGGLENSEENGTLKSNWPNSLQPEELSSQNILLVEAYEDDYRRIGPLLKASGVKFNIAYSGSEAWKLWNSFVSGTYTAIIVDAKLMDMPYLRFVEKIRSSERGTEKVMVIAVGENFLIDDIKEGYKIGVNINISRPVKINKLLQVINKARGENL